MRKIFNDEEFIKKAYNAVIKGNAMPIAILILGLCLVFSANSLGKAMIKVADSYELNGQAGANGMYAIAQSNSYMGNAINNQSNNNLTSNSTNNKTMLDFVDTYRYLNISEDDLNKIVASPDTKIPYIKISGKYVFNKKALDKWLETARVEVK
ncbi:helix-turn-helix domain-containing protein [Clostridium folliculivorans]|uniref:Uncharacterized protein n=1 Tax=Clostridium folliculivorans TaxID=2886038 RepID=A0A9W5XZZ4_9CLOT|nr:helix-turn-helix domain-containing protein [Clostridium folliculivorans]GKU24011.1 hypothetical protein CFOLD11_08370 [Clostridium folliculivorans]GKU30126.1 hypothetical protein CFB3_22330 [Clostridium folliculivorans]